MQEECEDGDESISPVDTTLIHMLLAAESLLLEGAGLSGSARVRMLARASSLAGPRTSSRLRAGTLKPSPISGTGVLCTRNLCGTCVGTYAIHALVLYGAYVVLLLRNCMGALA